MTPSTVATVPPVTSKHDPERAKKIAAAVARMNRADAKLRQARDDRDDVIREAHRDGFGVLWIAKAAGLSHPTVIKILRDKP